MSSNLSIQRLKPIEWMLAVLIVLAPLYYHYNLGGTGFRLPSNITVWAAASVIIFYSLYKLASAQVIILPRYSLLLLAFPVLAIYGAMMAGIIIPSQWFFRLLFIIGGTFFLFSLFQYRLHQPRIDRVLFLIVIAAFIHASIGLGQIVFNYELASWIPYNKAGLPTGLFQQINNQATFQVTALLISFWLLTRPSFNKKISVSLIFILSFIALSIFVTSYSGSRIAVLSFILSLPLFLLSRWKWIVKHKLRWMSVLIVIVLSVVLSTQFQGANNGGLKSVAEKSAAMNSGYSGSARLGMYKIAFEIIQESPWLGHGIGSFVREWQLAKPEFYQKNPDAFLPNSRVSHPHNEIIFWLVEGGIIVSIGLALFFIAVLLTLYQLPRTRRYAYASMILPLALHTQVELPFYISSILWFVFLILIFVIFNSSTREKVLQLSNSARLTIKVGTVISSTVVSVFFMHTVLASIEFKHFIKDRGKTHTFDIAAVNPYFKRFTMEQMMSNVLYRSMRYGQKQNVKDIVVWMDTQLANNPHFMYFQSLAKAYHYLGDQNKACLYIENGHAIYPDNSYLKKAVSKCPSDEKVN